MFGKGYIFTLIKGFFKLVIVALILFVVGILAWRFSEATPKKELLTLTPNEKLVEAYKEKGEKLVLVTQEQNSITRAEHNYGYFAVCDVVFIPEIEQLQILVRYNDSTLKALKNDYKEDFSHLGEGEYPDSSKDWYDVSVLISRDLTPDNSEDNLGNVRDAIKLIRISPTSVAESTHEGRYSYRRLVFDGVTLDKETLAVFADFYYLGDIRYKEEGFDVNNDSAYGTLCLYTFKDNDVFTELTKDDIKAIENYIENDA